MLILQLGAQQPVDQTAQPIRVPKEVFRGLDTACSHEDEIALHLLIFSVGRFQMLVPVSERSSTGLSEPQYRIACRPHQVVSQM